MSDSGTDSSPLGAALESRNRSAGAMPNYRPAMDPHADPDEPSIRAAVADADLRVLLLCLFQITGDECWLEPPHRPVRDVRLVADEHAGLPPEIQADVRAAAVDLLRSGIPQPAIAVPDDTTLLRMMRVCLDEQVEEAYVPMMRDQLGFAPALVDWSSAEGPKRDRGLPHVAVVGAGVSGIAIGVQLARLGIPFTIIEKNERAGGVWFENRYPGCGVDTPNHAYSFSFGTPERWSRYFSPRSEIHGYLERIAVEHEVAPHIRFGTEVIGARWDEASCTWHLDLRSGDGDELDRLDAAIMISAIGQMNLPSIPDLEGASTFVGPAFHSARWPDDLDLDGRRVAVIGTGATSMQLVPSIADRAGHLDVFQRSAQWVRPIAEYHREVSTGTQWLLDHVPFYAAWFRFTLLWRYGDGLLPFLVKDPDWPHPERSLNRGNDRHRQELTDHIVSSLADHPQLVDACLPTYPPYGKRMLIDNGWYETIARPDVDLVTSPIERITPDGIVTEDGLHHPADVIVYATGFHVTDLTARLGVLGRGGQRLDEAWADDNPTAYLGITVPGFPNLFCMYGPNTNLGHGGSIMFQAESQARYITDAIVQMVERDIDAIECRPEPHDRWVHDVDAAHERMIWTHPGMSTWYRNRHGRVVSVSPFRLVDYWSMTRHADLDDYVASPATR